MKFDALNIEILEDGTIKTTTDAVSGANHANAEQFLKYIATLAGGPTDRQRRGDVHHHHGHTHSHDHGDTDHEH
jgi:hypothetical protein